MTSAYLLVLDTLRSEVEHRYDWLCHNRAARAVCERAREQVDLADRYPGGEYIRDARRGTTDGIVRVRFEDDVNVYLTMAAENGTTITVGDGVGGSVTDRVPMAMIAREGQTACFAAVLEPVRAGSQPRVNGLQSAQEGDIRTVTVDLGGPTDEIKVLRDSSLLVNLSQ
jgi:hypothetical protein